MVSLHSFITLFLCLQPVQFTSSLKNNQLSEAIAQAALIWPELAEQRTRLLWKVIEAGIEAIETGATRSTDDRLSHVQALAESMDGVWPPNWRAELTRDWPN